MLKDVNGKNCTAKSIYVTLSIAIIFQVVTSGLTIGLVVFPVADFTGLAALWTIAGGVYYGRSHTKETKSV